MLRSVFIMIAAYFSTEIYEILENGLLISRGNMYSRRDEPIFFWMGVVYYFSLMAANVYFVFVFRVGKNEKLEQEESSATSDSTDIEKIKEINESDTLKK
ncbi:hypothetical protein ACSV5M_21270 [Cellvibrio sp. ARAG 10.3]|uniref:hypothetical protein n=1 Tax=Cellvibrio sp. ARAG 10.3 TaxID=3451358 RepID=UPI003F48A5EA